MKTAYLLLENGCTITGQTNSEGNALGKAEFNGTNAVLHAGGKECQFKLDYVPSYLPSEMVGKIVVDKLPLEFHMYDIKSTFIA